MAVRESFRAVLAEPAEPGAPGPMPRDWLLVAVAVAALVTEGALRPELTWRPIAVAAAAAVALALPWRRTHPLAMLVLAFGSAIPLDLLISLNEGTSGLGTMIFVLLFPYALVRWGSGRAIVAGLAFLVVPVALGIANSWTGVGDAIGATAVVLAPIAFGAAVRKTSNDRTRKLAQMKLLERERLARELHDTVAHHVSAIVIQAQAGRTVATTRPDAAVTALENIEAAATEALAEMRAMVRILRDADRDEGADALAPLGGIADLERLALRSGDLEIRVERSGRLDLVSPAVDAAVYRLVQESITNAVRHAERATTVSVVVAADGDAVRLRVHDDGIGAGDTTPLPGYGIVGMTERARLLGGTCDAGPDPSGGWVVSAVLPSPSTDGVDRTSLVTDATCAISTPGGMPAVGRPSSPATP